MFFAMLNYFTQTYNEKGQGMFHQSTATTQKRNDHYNDTSENENVNSNVV